MIQNIIVSIIFIQFCFSIPLLNRLLVPIYYTTSFTYGYDSNILKFSEEEKLDSETEPWLLGRNLLTSSVLKGSTSLLYIPYIFNGHETQLKVKINYSDFIDSSDKKYYSYSIKLAQHLRPFSWLKFSYSLLPELYLREYVDRDNLIYYLYSLHFLIIIMILELTILNTCFWPLNCFDNILLLYAVKFKNGHFRLL